MFEDLLELPSGKQKIIFLKGEPYILITHKSFYQVLDKNGIQLSAIDLKGLYSEIIEHVETVKFDRMFEVLDVPEQLFVVCLEDDMTYASDRYQVLSLRYYNKEYFLKEGDALTKLDTWKVVVAPATDELIQKINEYKQQVIKLENKSKNIMGKLDTIECNMIEYLADVKKEYTKKILKGKK